MPQQEMDGNGTDLVGEWKENGNGMDCSYRPQKRNTGGTERDSLEKNACTASTRRKFQSRDSTSFEVWSCDLIGCIPYLFFLQNVESLGRKHMSQTL